MRPEIRAGLDWRLCFAAVLISLSVWAPESISAESAAVRVLSVKEVPELGRDDSSVCADSALACVADYKSTLDIKPNLTKLVPESGKVESLSLTIRGQREDLVEALNAFSESMKFSGLLVRDCPRSMKATRGATKESECAALSGKFEEQRKILIRSLERYVQRAPESFGLQPNPDKNAVRRALGDAYSDPVKTGAWIAGKISELDSASGESSAALREGLKKLQIRIGAFHIRSGKQPSPLHLSNYDNYEAKNVKPVDRISFEVSEEQEGRLKEEAKFNASMAKEISGLKDGSSEILKALRTHAANLKVSAEKIQKRVNEAVDLFRGQSRVDFSDALESLKDGATATGKKNLDEISVELRRIGDRLLTYKGVLDSARLLLDIPIIQTDGARPDLALKTLLGRVEAFHGGLTAKANEDVAEVVKSLNRMQVILNGSSAEFGQAGGQAREQLLSAQVNLIGDLVRISSDIEKTVRDEILSAAPVFLEYKTNVQKYVDGASPILEVNLSSPSIHTVPGEKAGPTSLDLATTGVEAGDSVEIAVEVERDGEKGIVHEERKSIRIEKFGWSSNVVGGLGFVKSELSSQANFEPVPTMTWLVSQRNRPGQDGLASIAGDLGMGFGIHTVGLDFDPNSSVEVGTGVSVHFFRDILQVGYGANLNIPRKRQYFFVGLRLFQMLK